MEWTYLNKPFTSDQIDHNVGFVYLIENLHNGKKYIGKKLFTFAKTRGPLKGRVNRRRSRVMSDWANYFGSNKELQADVEKQGPAKIKRTITRLCKSKSECNYYEAKGIFEADALLNDNYYNSWISCRINTNQMKK